MTRRDWLTLFIALEGAPDGLDPVRIQTGMFLFSVEADVPADEKYRFAPYDYGPMSDGIYRDLDELARLGLATREDVQGKRWSSFRVTEAGLVAGRGAMEEAQSHGHLLAAQTLHHIKRRVASLPFAELLERIYGDYPEYAVKSVFRRTA